MVYGSESRLLLADVGLKFERAEMQLIRWIFCVSMKDKRSGEALRNLVGFEAITTVIGLTSYGHVMGKNYEHWVKKCMEI